MNLYELIHLNEPLVNECKISMEKRSFHVDAINVVLEAHSCHRTLIGSVQPPTMLSWKPCRFSSIVIQKSAPMTHVLNYKIVLIIAIVLFKGHKNTVKDFGT